MDIIFFKKPYKYNHNWQQIKSQQYRYFICEKCQARKVSVSNYSELTFVNFNWLNFKTNTL